MTVKLDFSNLPDYSQAGAAAVAAAQQAAAPAPAKVIKFGAGADPQVDAKVEHLLALQSALKAQGNVVTQAQWNTLSTADQTSARAWGVRIQAAPVSAPDATKAPPPAGTVSTKTALIGGSVLAIGAALAAKALL
jgi:hypothetical protein